jgi:hypothetical protein
MQTFKRKRNHQEQVKKERKKIQENKHEVRKKISSALFIVVAADSRWQT